MEENKTKDIFFSIAQKVYLLGASNYWPDDLKLPKCFYKIHDHVFLLIDLIINLFICTEWLAFFTQKNLTDKQRGDLVMFASAHPIAHSYCFIMTFHKEKIREVLLHLTINLKSTFNDREVERQMIRRSKIYTTISVSLILLTTCSYGVNALCTDGPFTTVITAWPNVEDRSFKARLVRIVAYFMWWLLLVRLFSAICVIIPVTILLSHQFKNLKSYFCSLSNIFEGDESQAEKETKYEEAFKLGIKHHADTLRCTRLCQDAFYFVYSGHILLNISVIIMVTLQFLTSERTFTGVMQNFSALMATLVSTGCFMWSAGDVTIEASKLPTAMFESGWHNCRTQTSRRIRPLVVIAMWQSQKDVQLRCLGVIKMSYRSFISIVRASYSVVSVLF